MTSQPVGSTQLDHFFSASAARMDRWRAMSAEAQTWAAQARSGSRAGRAEVDAALAEVAPLEDFFAYPGARLMKSLTERIAADDALGAARLVARVSGALLSGSYRHENGEAESADSANDTVPDRLPPSLNGGEARRPYFETLFVSSAPSANR